MGDPLILAVVIVFIGVAVLTAMVASVGPGAPVAGAAPPARDDGSRWRAARPPAR